MLLLCKLTTWETDGISATVTRLGMTPGMPQLQGTVMRAHLTGESVGHAVSYSDFSKWLKSTLDTHSLFRDQVVIKSRKSLTAGACRFGVWYLFLQKPQWWLMCCCHEQDQLGLLWNVCSACRLFCLVKMEACQWRRLAWNTDWSILLQNSSPIFSKED